MPRGVLRKRGASRDEVAGGRIEGCARKARIKRGEHNG